MEIKATSYRSPRLRQGIILTSRLTFEPGTYYKFTLHERVVVSCVMVEAEAEQVSLFKDEGETVRVHQGAGRLVDPSTPLWERGGNLTNLTQIPAFLPAAHPFLRCL